ncbi:hypothetical protein GCM10009801_73000 [Streptomyces albiaxialis]|uniref:DUF4878 domain-containing protein n=1 Tax=Streptomyces albiaxialis TaxID=329523 RepID=A0ABP5IKY1_9ACTN
MNDRIRSSLAWVLHSPRRLVAVLGAVVLVLVLVAALDGEDEHQEQDAKPAPSRSAPRSSAPASPSPSTPPDLNAALDTGRAVVALWASHQDRDAWLRDLKPHVTERFAARLASVDPDRIESRKIGKARNTDTGGDTLTSVAVSTDAGPVTVNLMWQGERWWAYAIEPGAQPEA